MTLLGKRYATALHMAATAAGGDVKDTVGKDVQALHEILASPAARALVTSPDVKVNERAAILQKLGAGRHPLVQNLLGVLQSRHRLEVLFDVHEAYHALLLEQRGEVDGIVLSPRPLSAEQVQELAELASRLSGKKVSLSVVLRPELLGGVSLRIGNVLYDGSMAAALAQLEQRLLQSSI